MSKLISILILTTFFASGCSALVYQLVWQRYLFVSLGVDIDSVTLIVSAFMLGIGIGGALGGWIADERAGLRLRIYGLFELALAVLGFLSPWFFGGVNSLIDYGWSSFAINMVAIFVIIIPTTLMGATLPLLTLYFDETLDNIGVSVGKLYFVNTLGAAAGVWLTSHYLYVEWGLRASVWFAAAVNLLCCMCAVVAARILLREKMQSRVGEVN